MGKSNSNAKTAANRLNAKDSTGPKNTSSTRFNATKHGLLALGVTELDDADGYRDTLRDVKREKNPVGVVEESLVESIALDIIRLRRARRLEAEYITEVLNPSVHEPGALADLPDWDKGRLVDPGLPATMHCGGVQLLVGIFLRYESGITLRLFRNLHELERLQRMRQGERLPAPAVVDVGIHTGPKSADSLTERSDKAILEGALSQPLDKQEDLG